MATAAWAVSIVRAQSAEALPTKREMGSRSVSMQLSSVPAESGTKAQVPFAPTQPVPASSTSHRLPAASFPAPQLAAIAAVATVSEHPSGQVVDEGWAPAGLPGESGDSGYEALRTKAGGA